MREDFGHVQTAVALADLRQGLVRAEPATAASADVITAEQGTLRAGINFQHVAHGRLGTDSHHGQSIAERRFCLNGTKRLEMGTLRHEITASVAIDALPARTYSRDPFPPPKDEAS